MERSSHSDCCNNRDDREVAAATTATTKQRQRQRHSSKRILIVGDGDCSASLAIIRAYIVGSSSSSVSSSEVADIMTQSSHQRQQQQHHNQEDPSPLLAEEELQICITTLVTSYEELIQLYPQTAARNIQEIHALLRTVRANQSVLGSSNTTYDSSSGTTKSSTPPNSSNRDPQQQQQEQQEQHRILYNIDACQLHTPSTIRRLQDYMHQFYNSCDDSFLDDATEGVVTVPTGSTATSTTSTTHHDLFDIIIFQYPHLGTTSTTRTTTITTTSSGTSLRSTTSSTEENHDIDDNDYNKNDNKHNKNDTKQQQEQHPEELHVVEEENDEEREEEEHILRQRHISLLYHYLYSASHIISASTTNGRSGSDDDGGNGMIHVTLNPTQYQSWIVRPNNTSYTNHSTSNDCNPCSSSSENVETLNIVDSSIFTQQQQQQKQQQVCITIPQLQLMVTKIVPVQQPFHYIWLSSSTTTTTTTNGTATTATRAAIATKTLLQPTNKRRVSKKYDGYSHRHYLTKYGYHHVRTRGDCNDTRTSQSTTVTANIDTDSPSLSQQIRNISTKSKKKRNTATVSLLGSCHYIFQRTKFPNNTNVVTIHSNEVDPPEFHCSICGYTSSNEMEHRYHLQFPTDKNRYSSSDTTRKRKENTISNKLITTESPTLRNKSVDISISGIIAPTTGRTETNETGGMRIETNTGLLDTNTIPIIDEHIIPIPIASKSNNKNINNDDGTDPAILMMIKYLIVWKPVGIRTIGTFHDRTLEQLLYHQHNQQLQQNDNNTSLLEDFACSNNNNISSLSACSTYKSLSKLDKCCGGLCCVVQQEVVQPQQQHLKNDGDISTPFTISEINHYIEVQHTFTALVYGTCPDSWKNGISIELPVNGLRRWNKKKGTKDLNTNNVANTVNIIDTNATMNRDETINKTSDIVQAANDIEVTETGIAKSTNVEGATTTLTLIEQTRPNSGSCATTTDVDTASIPSLSTISITTTSTASGLAQIIGYYLRSCLHYPIVGDRMAGHEYNTLPRSIRNRIKQRLCMGCTGILLRVNDSSAVLEQQKQQLYETKHPIPLKWSAFYWQDFALNQQYPNEHVRY